jgi:hypothetical protein
LCYRSISLNVAKGQISLNQWNLFNAERPRVILFDAASERFKSGYDRFPGIMRRIVWLGTIRRNYQLYQDVCTAGSVIFQKKKRMHKHACTIPFLSPKRKSPNDASASLPEARLDMCKAPLILENRAGEPSGNFSLSLTF